jgi:hypothetical protein
MPVQYAASLEFSLGLFEAHRLLRPGQVHSVWRRGGERRKRVIHEHPRARRRTTSGTFCARIGLLRRQTQCLRHEPSCRVEQACTIFRVACFCVPQELRTRIREVPVHGTPAIIYALMPSTSATPVFGRAVLGPTLGATSAWTVGLTALAINLTAPPVVVLLEMDAAAAPVVVLFAARYKAAQS